MILSHADSGTLAAWHSWSMTRKLEKDETCEFCYAPAVSVCILAGLPFVKSVQKLETGRRFAMIAAKAGIASSRLEAKASAS